MLLSAAQSNRRSGALAPLRNGRAESKYLPRLAQGEISGFALTERNVGCDISKVETYAVRVWEQGKTVGYSTHWRKFFITNSAKRDGEFLSSMLVVIARIVDRPEEVNDPRRKSAMAHLSWKHNGRDVLSPASGSRESERFTMVSRRFTTSTSRLKTGWEGKKTV